jgi:hypothetical protein
MESNSLIHKPKRQKLNEEQGIDVDRRISVPKLHFLSIKEFVRQNSGYGNDCQVMIFGVGLKEFYYAGLLFNDYCLYVSFSLEKAEIDTCSIFLPNADFYRTNQLLMHLEFLVFFFFYLKWGK